MSRIVHFEFVTADPEKTAAFFEKALGWKVRKWDGPMEYWLAETGAPGTPGINGGVARSREAESLCTTTAEVTDLDATLASVEANGGTVVVPRHAIPGVGWAAYCKEPCGVIFGLMQGDPNAR